jgi:hypothetical protein
MSAIDDKYDELTANGIDLGSPLGGEENAEAGGRVRQYANGHIYWCSATVRTWCVAGSSSSTWRTAVLGRTQTRVPAILAIRRATRNTSSGRASLTANSNGALSTGHPEPAAALSMGSGDGRLLRPGLPITGNVQVAGGQAIYFERGVVFSAGGAPGVDRLLVGPSHHRPRSSLSARYGGPEPQLRQVARCGPCVSTTRSGLGARLSLTSSCGTASPSSR